VASFKPVELGIAAISVISVNSFPPLLNFWLDQGLVVMGIEHGLLGHLLLGSLIVWLWFGAEVSLPDVDSWS
jgi:hypothetical protein